MHGRTSVCMAPTPLGQPPGRLAAHTPVEYWPAAVLVCTRIPALTVKVNTLICCRPKSRVSLSTSPNIPFKSSHAVPSLSGAAACGSSRHEIGTRSSNPAFPNISNNLNRAQACNLLLCSCWWALVPAIVCCCVQSSFQPVSYTHLTLPTIYSV